MLQARLDPIDLAVEEEAGSSKDVGVSEGTSYRDSNSNNNSNIYANTTNN